MKMNFNSYLQKILQAQTAKNPFGVASTQNANKEEILSQLSLFTGASAEELANIDMEKLLESENAEEALGENATAEDKVLAEMVKALLELEGVQGAADADEDGKLSAEEATAFLNDIMGKDGDISSLTMEDIDAAIEELGIDLQEVAEETIEEVLNEDKVEEAEPEEEVSKAKEAQQAQSSGGANGGSSAAGGAGRSNGVSSSGNNKPQGLDGMSLQELEAEKATREKTLSEKQDAVNAVHNGENAEVKSAQEEYDTAEEEYNEAVKNDNKIPQELKEQQAANVAAIDENEAAIDKNAVEINNTQGEVDTLEGSVTSLKSNLSSLEGSLSSLPQKSGKEEDAEKDAQIDEKRQSIEKQISAKQDEIDAEEQKLADKKKDLGDLEDTKTDLEKSKTELEQERQEIEAEIEKTCSEETKQKMTAYNEAKTNLETVKNEQLKAANAELDTAKTDVTEINEKITEVKNKELEKENSVYDGNISSELASAIDAKCGAGFSAKVEEIAKKLNCDPNDLLGMMYSESGLNSTAVNGSSGATGLIQFMPSTAQGLGTSTAELANMSPIEQLDYVEKFFDSNMKMAGIPEGQKLEAGTLYALVFLPAYANRDVLTTQGENYYNANSGLDTNGDGKITIDDLTQRVKGKYNELYGAMV
ncbi:MAG: transglycosylase SLT domain-containing protein [Candidatus Gastranaerophilaceae bacterium]